MAKLRAPEGKIILEKFISQTDSGLEVPEGAKGESRIGIVHSFGKPRKDDPKINLVKGMKLIFKKYVSNTLYVPQIGGNFDFIEYDDIVAILVEGK